ncbi:Crp/Fnr family transcriptional regulator [Acidovorax sp. HMWF029]|uniref:Crp/Fnr family transcriptional regulator n=1 Tax=Acidovorax sp. HMWF029 TaxID=2056863 RepID=UPI000D39DD08|nr:Crp/Fnr family transcriptional regulator [Acidovorax sp. HMWF029]PTT18567.1 Crp/Fnr family transcriptional regulator [Acidovorax sp. HMWF029]
MLSTLPPAPRFISAQPWFSSVPNALKERLREEVFSVQGDKGAVMMHAGSAVEGWHAVLSGLVMLQSPAGKGRSSAFIGVPDGEWFGEGSAMKPEPRRYNVVALRPTTLLCLPLPLFATLRESSLAFNQFLVQHLNMRLGQAMTIIEAGRTQSPEHRVALYLSRLFWRSTRRLNLTQDELGQLVGLSRQTVNRVLRTLEEGGIVSLDFGKVAIVDDEALGAYLTATAAA